MSADFKSSIRKNALLPKEHIINRYIKFINHCQIKKRAAAKRPRVVKKGLRSRSLAASKYSYKTPMGFCETGKDLFELYPTFTKNTLTVIGNDVIISSKFASIHNEFIPYIGKTFAEYGIVKEERN